MQRRTLGMLALVALVVVIATVGLATHTTAASNYLDDAGAELALLGGGDISWQGLDQTPVCFNQACEGLQGLCCGRNPAGVCICACKFLGGQLGCHACGNPGICPA